MNKVTNLNIARQHRETLSDAAVVAVEMLRTCSEIDIEDLTTCVQQCARMEFLAGLLLSVVSVDREQWQANRAYADDLKSLMARSDDNGKFD